MISLSPPFELYVLFGLVVWVIIRALWQSPRRLGAAIRKCRWTIADWFNVTFWIAFALAILRSIAVLIG